MPRYKATLTEETIYEMHVEADTLEEAQDKALEDFGCGGGTEINNYVDYIVVEESK